LSRLKAAASASGTKPALILFPQIPGMDKSALWWFIAPC
jgi:hypothetical protein